MNVAKPRVRCRACGQRVSRGLSVCPFCGHDPVRFHTRWSTTALSVLCGLLLGIVLAPLAPRPLGGPSVLATGTAKPIVVVRPTFTPTRLPTATTTGTPIAPPARTTIRPLVEAPRLVSPKDQAEFGGEGSEIFLQWEGILHEGQQYAVTVHYVGRADETKAAGSWLHETRWRVPASLYGDLSLSLRALKWDVSIVDASGNALSGPSESRIFYWR
ncbi:MAG TPA: hypothetical protein VFG86_13315 [Chloroflexota bacterium]|nr:hypothetical protein [Chloroflexota bacterium]